MWWKSIFLQHCIKIFTVLKKLQTFTFEKFILKTSILWEKLCYKPSNVIIKLFRWENFAKQISLISWWIMTPFAIFTVLNFQTRLKGNWSFGSTLYHPRLWSRSHYRDFNSSKRSQVIRRISHLFINFAGKQFKLKKIFNFFLF